MPSEASPARAGMSVDPTTLLGGGSRARGRSSRPRRHRARPARRGGPDRRLGADRPASDVRSRRCRSRPTARCSRASLGDPRGDRQHAQRRDAADPGRPVGGFGFRAGLFNIGANGQFLIGAFFAAIVGSTPHRPVPLRLLLALFAGFVGGALWGFIPGVLKAWRGAHEVVTTIMLNYVAYLLLNRWPAGRSGPERDVPADARHHARRRAADPPRRHPPARRDHRRPRSTAVVVWFLLFKTTLGFEIRTVGINAYAARYAA